MSIPSNQLRAARVLLCLSREELAALSHVGVTTISRYEMGAGVTAQNARTLRAAAEAAGAVILDGQGVVGRRIGDGMALLGDDELPPETRQRITARAEDDPDGRPRRSGRPRKRHLPDTDASPEATPPDQG